jgi:hypothetical protein
MGHPAAELLEEFTDDQLQTAIRIVRQLYNATERYRRVDDYPNPFDPALSALTIVAGERGLPTA